MNKVNWIREEAGRCLTKNIHPELSVLLPQMRFFFRVHQSARVPSCYAEFLAMKAVHQGFGYSEQPIFSYADGEITFGCRDMTGPPVELGSIIDSSD